MKLTPTQYFQRQGWISFDPEEATLALTAKWIGPDRVIWGSDFPHPDAFYPNFIDMLKALAVYEEVGYPYMIMPDHVPSMSGPEASRVGFAYSYGYIQAALQVAGAK